MNVFTPLALLVSSSIMIGMDTNVPITARSLGKDVAMILKSQRSYNLYADSSSALSFDDLHKKALQLPFSSIRPYTPVDPLVDQKEHHNFVSYWTSNNSHEESFQPFIIDSTDYTQAPLIGYMLHIPTVDNAQEQFFLQRRAEIECLHHHCISQKAYKYIAQIQALEKEHASIVAQLLSLTKKARALVTQIQHAPTDSEATTIDTEIQTLSSSIGNIIHTIEDQTLRDKINSINNVPVSCDGSLTDDSRIQQLGTMSISAFLLLGTTQKHHEAKVKARARHHQIKYYLEPEKRQLFYDRAACVMAKEFTGCLGYLGKKITCGALFKDAQHPTYRERFEHIKAVEEYIKNITTNDELHAAVHGDVRAQGRA